jgi:class I fructose-bisphosphate aldolase
MGDAMIDAITKNLGEKADYYLGFKSPKIPKEKIHVPTGDWVDRIFAPTDRNNRVLVNLQRSSTPAAWRAPGTSRSCPSTRASSTPRARASPKNPEYFDAENIVKLAIEGGCNAVASTYGVLGMVARKYAHRIPFLVKINHNELLTYPEQVRPDHVRHREGSRRHGRGGGRRHDLLRLDESGRQIVEVARAFHEAHELGMATVLWCYIRNSAFKKDKDYHVAADLTGQANHLGVTIEADIIKQKLPENNGGFKALNTAAPATASSTSASTRTSRATTRSISAATRSPTATWAARASSTAAAPRARTTSPRRR